MASTAQNELEKERARLEAFTRILQSIKKGGASPDAIAKMETILASVKARIAELEEQARRVAPKRTEPEPIDVKEEKETQRVAPEQPAAEPEPSDAEVENEYEKALEKYLTVVRDISTQETEIEQLEQKIVEGEDTPENQSLYSTLQTSLEMLKNNRERANTALNIAQNKLRGRQLLQKLRTRNDLLARNTLSWPISNVVIATQKQISDIVATEYPSNQLEQKRTVTDGNCQFDALSIALYGNSSKLWQMRAAICDHILDNIVLYWNDGGVTAQLADDGTKAEGWAFELTFETFTDYIKKMRPDNTEWGTELTLQAAANLFAATVVVLNNATYTKRAIPPEYPTTSSLNIYVVFNNSNHYYGILPKTSPQIVSRASPTPQSLAFRIHFTYEADLAEGREREFASELNPVLHVFAGQGLGASDADDGVVVVPTSVLTAAPMHISSTDLGNGNVFSGELINLDTDYVASNARLETALKGHEALVNELLTLRPRLEQVETKIVPAITNVYVYVPAPGTKFRIHDMSTLFVTEEQDRFITGVVLKRDTKELLYPTLADEFTFTVENFDKPLSWFVVKRGNVETYLWKVEKQTIYDDRDVTVFETMLVQQTTIVPKETREELSRGIVKAVPTNTQATMFSGEAIDLGKQFVDSIVPTLKPTEIAEVTRQRVKTLFEFGDIGAYENLDKAFAARADPPKSLVEALGGRAKAREVAAELDAIFSNLAVATFGRRGVTSRLRRLDVLSKEFARVTGIKAPPSRAFALASAENTVVPGELVVDIPFNPHGTNRTSASALLPGARASRAAVVDAQGRPFIPADATVSFNAYAETATHAGQLCRTRAGEALFLVSDLLATTPSTDDSVRAEWQTTGDVPLVKGFIDVRHAELIDTTTGAPVDPTSVFRYEPLMAHATAFHEFDAQPTQRDLAVKTAEELAQRVNASLDVFFGKNAVLATSDPPTMQRMHCPYFNTSAGLVFGSGYAVRTASQPPPVHFFERTLAATLVRNDARAEHVLAAIAAQRAAPATTLPSSRFVAKVFAEMLTPFANAMVYLDDFTNEGGNTYVATVSDDGMSPDASTRHATQRLRLVRRSSATEHIEGSESRPLVNVVEDYKDARLGHGDDCEGVAKEIYTQFWSFHALELDGTESPLLRELHSFARSNVYTPALVLAEVTNKKLDTDAITDGDALAHTYTALIHTDTFLDRLDGTNTDAIAALRSSEWARARRKEPWHAGLDDVLVTEGTARSSVFVRPTTSYYATRAEQETVREAAKRRFTAQQALVEHVPMNIVQMDIPNRRIDDPDGAIAANKADTSDFYKANSAMYVSAFAETGVLDVAFAQRRNGALTHGTRFTPFAASKWPSTSVLVPYNQLTKRDGALVDAVLSQLEPVPRLRRDAATAESREREGPPDALLAVEHLFDGSVPTTGAATEHLLRDPAQMPLIPSNIVLTIRAEDATDTAIDAVVNGIAAASDYFSAARVHTHYLSEAPVHGDETSLPPVVLYDIELFVKHD